MNNLALSEQVGHILTEKKLTVSTAESCTGGLILSTLTDISGSSAYVMGGLVTYSNEAKMKHVYVQEQTLIQYGAVSEPTAREMAIGVRRVFDTSYALSVTGIAGPRGGTMEKPVGLTFIGLAGHDDIVAVQRHIWTGDRIENKRASVHAALTLLLAMLEKN